MKKFHSLLAILTIAGVTAAKAAITDAPQWTVNPSDYQYDMTTYISVSLDGKGNVLADYSNLKVAAFVGDECRGVAEFASKSGYNYGYLRIYSNVADGETVTFRAYDSTSGREMNYTPSQSLSFTSQGLQGMPSTPFLLSTVLGDADNDGKITISDVTCLIDLYLGSEDIEYNPYLVDMDSDGNLTIADVTSLIDAYLAS